MRFARFARLYLKFIIVPVGVGFIGGLVGLAVVLRYVPDYFKIQEAASPPLPSISTVSSFSSVQMKALKDNLVFFVNPAPKAPYVAVSESMGIGFALTSDGLVATAAPLIASARKAVTADRKVHDIERIVDKRGAMFHIPDTGLTLVKVLDASLKVVPFASYERLNVGDTLISFDQKGMPRLHRLVLVWDHTAEVDRIESSEELSNFFRLDGERGVPGTPVYTLRGELVGVFDAKGRVIPGLRIQEAVGRYISRGTVKKTFLGVHFVDLNNLIATTAEGGLNNQKEGLLLKDGRMGKAIVKGSPAQKSGLKAGDILLELEGQRLNGAVPFQFILQRYRPGTEVEFLISRDKAEQKIKVALGEE